MSIDGFREITDTEYEEVPSVQGIDPKAALVRTMICIAVIVVVAGIIATICAVK